MKRYLGWMRDFLVGVFIFVVCGMVLSAYIKLEPPASVITTLFRMADQMLLNVLIIILGVILLIGIVLWKKRGKIREFTGVCIILIGICFIGTAIQWMRLLTATSIKTQIDYKPIKAGESQKHSVLKEVKDASKELGVDECKVYCPSEGAKTCIIYMNYGGWNVQDESMGQQVYQFCEKEGYGFIRFAKARGEGKYIDAMALEASEALDKLLDEMQFEHVFLCGGSAGGHMALLCAYGTEQNERLPMKNLAIDGVIGLYPCVDPEASYDYFVGADDKNKSVLDRIGDKLYGMVYGDEDSTLGNSTRTLDESVFGLRNDPQAFYEVSAIKNLIDGKQVPVLIVQGALDTMNYVESVRTFTELLKNKENVSAYLELPGTDHVFDIMPTAAWKRCEMEMTGFIRTVISDNQ